MKTLPLLVLSTQAAFGSSSSTYDLPNPGFEHPLGAEASNSWKIGNYGHQVTRDFEIRFRGTASLRLDSVENPQSSGLGHEVAVDLIRKNLFRMTGYVRTADLDGGASLFVIVDKESGQRHYDFMAGSIESGDKDWTKLELLIPNIPDATRARVGLLVWGYGTAWFDDLHLERIDTDLGLSDQASTYLTHALDIMETNSIVRDSVDWREVRNTARMLASGAEKTEDTYAPLEFAIRSIGDGHSHLLRPSAAEILKSGDMDVAAPSGRLLVGKIGYVNVPGFRGVNEERMTRFADELQDLIGGLDAPRVCGWIVDLRSNGGGNVFPMLAGLGPLLGDGDAGGGVTADGKLIPQTYMDGRAGIASVSKSPYELLEPNPPVAVLIGERTASSGEATALAFIGRPATRTFGQPSAGATTGNSPYALEDGAILNLAVTKMIDRNGKVYGGKIEPDVLIDSTDSSGTIDAALSWLDTQCE